MGDIQRSLREWADFFNVPFGTFRSWAYELEKRSPFYESDTRAIAAHGSGKAARARGNTAIAGQRNYINVVDKLNGND